MTKTYCDKCKIEISKIELALWTRRVAAETQEWDLCKGCDYEIKMRIEGRVG